MFLSIENSTDYLTAQASSEQRAVDELLLRCNAFLRQRGAYDVLTAAVVARELLVNAIKHGNHNIQDRRVTLQIRDRGNGVFTIRVEDEGEGFDYNSLDMTLPDDPRLIKRRGMLLVNALSEKIEFNEKGNCVTAYLNLCPDTARKTAVG